ncbi:MAG: hypothetical protein M1826_003356 [Phylliscum demangeonii]|nr:MAG: hypothetical protein M1826_003356 [Phylliscum demangeonii]
MAAINGRLHVPPPPAVISSGKRKRVEDAPPHGQDIIRPGSLDDSKHHSSALPAFLKDLLHGLRRYDTEPSILSAPLESADDPLSAPAPKKPRVAASAVAETIASRIQAESYRDVEGLVADVEAAASSVLESSRLPPSPAKHGTLSSGQREKIAARVRAFKSAFAEMILQEKAPERMAMEMNHAVTAVAVEGGAQSARLPSSTRDAYLPPPLLIIQGSAPQPKLLFSSYPKPARSEATTTIAASSLPAGVSLSTGPRPRARADGGTKAGVPTIGELFAPPPAVKPLSPPKPSERTTTRGSVVDWYKAEDPALAWYNSPYPSWTNEPLPTGHWLSYGSVQSPARRPPSSPDTKRKRGLSTSDFALHPAPTPDEVFAQRYAKADARFRANYSSFAPTHDDSGVVVTAAQKADVWWDRVGHGRYLASLTWPCEPEPEPEPAAVEGARSAHDPARPDMDEDALFREAVDEWQPAPRPADFTADAPRFAVGPVADREVDEVLAEISELLETLNSYNRTRHLAISTSGSPHSTIPPDQSVARMLGTPSTPSEVETELYQLIRNQLALVIATLPPYAVAKLNGDQLAALTVSRRMRVPGPTYRGVMVEEHDGLVPRSAARHPVSSSAATAHAGAGSPSPAMLPPPTTATSAGYGSRPSYHGGGGSISSSSHGPRPSHLRSQLPPPPPPPILDPGRGTRSGGSATAGTPTMAPPPASSNPAGYGPTASVAYPRAAHTPQQPQPQPQPQPAAYGSQPTRAPRSTPNADPPKTRLTWSAYGGSPAVYAAPSPPPQPQPQTSPPALALTAGGGPTTTIPSSSSSTSASAPLGASGFHTYLTPAEQHSMLERQRAQVAAQQQRALAPPAVVRPPFSTDATAPSASASAPTTMGTVATTATAVAPGGGGAVVAGSSSSSVGGGRPMQDVNGTSVGVSSSSSSSSSAGLRPIATPAATMTATPAPGPGPGPGSAPAAMGGPVSTIGLP